MKLIPFNSGKVHLETSKRNLINYVRSNTTEDLPLISVTDYNSTNSEEFGSEIYADSFFVWKVPSGGAHNFINTTLHFRIYESQNGLDLKWHVRFNLWSNLITLVTIIAATYVLIGLIREQIPQETFIFLLALLPYPFMIWAFNSSMKENLKFLNKIEKTFANKG